MVSILSNEEEMQLISNATDSKGGERTVLHDTSESSLPSSRSHTAYQTSDHGVCFLLAMDGLLSRSRARSLRGHRAPWSS